MAGVTRVSRGSRGEVNGKAEAGKDALPENPTAFQNGQKDHSSCDKSENQQTSRVPSYRFPRQNQKFNHPEINPAIQSAGNPEIQPAQEFNIGPQHP